MQYEWGKNKAKTNARKHGIGFDEAVTVFGDPRALTFEDPDHSERERRFLTFGISGNGRYVIVSHTPRGENKGIRA